MKKVKKVIEQPVELEINNVNDLGKHLKEAIEKNPENKPSPEEIEQAKVDLDTAVQAFSVKSWNIGKTEDAVQFINYLQGFIRNRIFWTKNGWMGVIKIQEELQDSEKFVYDNPGKTPMKLGYQAIEFMFYSLQNPGGVGLQSAQDFESENEIYSKVFDSIGTCVTDARNELKTIQLLQDKYAAMQQGFYLEFEPADDEEAVYTLTEEEALLQEKLDGSNISVTKEEFIAAAEDSTLEDELYAENEFPIKGE